MTRGTRRLRQRLAALGPAAALLLLPATAWSDVVGEPPDDCPAGTRGDASHCGEHCDPIACSADEECEDGEICATRHLCAVTLRCATSAGTFTTESVSGSCSGSGPCGDGGTCQTFSVCVDEDADLRAGCGCRAGPRQGGAVGAAALVLSALILLGARRRRRSS